VNYIEASLPSKCLVYKDVDPAGIKIRKLCGEDEQLIADVTLTNIEKQFCLIFERLLIGIKPEQLTIGDRLYLLIREAIDSYSKDFPIKYTCGTCLQENSVLADLSKLDVTALPDGFAEPYQVILSEGKAVNLRLFRVADEIAIAGYTGRDSWIYRFALSIVDTNMDIMQKMQFFKKLPVRDTAAIREFHDKFYHGPKMQQAFECRFCGASEVVPVPFRLEMLLPTGPTLEGYLRSAV